MSTITLPNIRVSSDLTVKVRLKDGGVAIDWSTLSNIRALIYSDAQRAMAGRCAVSIDAEDATLLVCQYAANKPQYLGVNRIVVSATYQGETKTYDKPALKFVRWTDDQAGQEITISDPDVDVEIEVEDISSSILQEAVDAAFSAAERAEEAAAAAEHMVDIHTGPAGKSPYIGENGNWFEWDETTHQYVDTEEKAKGDTGETPDITIGTVTTAEPGTPAAATMTGTPEAPVLNLTIPKGVAGDTPAFTVGEVTTGEPGTPVVVTITGTAAAPVLNVTIPQGLQGNTGASVDYPYELVNNCTTNDATKGLSAAQGKVLKDEIDQLDLKVSDIIPVHIGGGAVEGRIKYNDTDKTLKIEADTQTRELTLDDIAYEGKTYKQIFETNNSLGINPGFEDGTFSPLVSSAGTPTITNDVADSGDYSMKCFGTSSTQVKTSSAWGTAYKQSMYVAMRARCDRYSAGTLGFSLTGIAFGLQAVSDGFETISTLSTPTYSTSSYPFLGSFSSANLDGYIDTPVVVLMNIFTNAPSKTKMDELYETYVLIKQGNAPTIVVGTTDIPIQLRDIRTFTDSACKDAFMTEVNKVAQRIGATSSNFPDASGLTSTDSYTTAQDLFRILVHAAGVEKIAEKWGRKSYSFNVYGTNARQVDITTSVKNTTYYDDEANPILGGKTGTLSLISPPTYNLMFITTIDVEGFLTAHTLGGVDVTKPVNLAVAFLGSNSDTNRWKDAQKLVDFITGIMNGQDVPSPAPNANYVAVGLLPDNPITYDNYPFKFLYSKSSTTAGVPASCTKIISLITAYENMADENEMVEIKSSDLIGGSGNNLQAGDFVRIKDLVYDALLPSSNDAITALSRIIGEKILRSRTL